MTIKYGSHNFKFDYAKFRNDLVSFHDAHDLNWTDIDALAGASIGSSNKLAMGIHTNNKMDTWLKFANLMDIDVRTYFILED